MVYSTFSMLNVFYPSLLSWLSREHILISLIGKKRKSDLAHYWMEMINPVYETIWYHSVAVCCLTVILS